MALIQEVRPLAILYMRLNLTDTKLEETPIVLGTSIALIGCT